MTMHDSRIITALAACGIATALASGTAAGESVAHQRFGSLIAEGVIEAPAGDTAMPDEAVTRKQFLEILSRVPSMGDIQTLMNQQGTSVWSGEAPSYDVGKAREMLGLADYYASRESDLVPIDWGMGFDPTPADPDLFPTGEQTTTFFQRSLTPTHGSSSSVIMAPKSTAALIPGVREMLADAQWSRLTALTPYADPTDPSTYDRYVYRYANAEALEDAVETAAAAAVDAPDSPWADFPFYADGLVSPAVPEELPGGAISAVYHGRLAGAFDNGTAIGADIALDVYFDQQIFGGSIAFEGGELPVNGDWSGPDQITGYFEGSALGGEVTGNLNGAFYGANVEEIGGSWALEVTAGATGGRTASGEFAAKR
jgi:hypothetical protein